MPAFKLVHDAARGKQERVKLFNIQICILC